MADKKPLKLHATALCPQQFEAGDTVPVDNGGTGLNEAALTGLAGEYLKVNATEDGYETGNPGGGGGASYLVYSALLSQFGTDDPTVDYVLDNTLGGTVVWERIDYGLYTGTLTGAFTENKTVTNQQNTSIVLNNNDQNIYLLIKRNSTNDVLIRTLLFDSLDSVDANLYLFFVEIRVYP